MGKESKGLGDTIEKMIVICIYFGVNQHHIRIHSMQEKYCRYKKLYVIIVNDM